MAEKNLKLILEEKERKVKESKRIEVLSFKANIQITAYYQPNNYERVNHLSETTCFKNKNISIEDSKMNKNISIEDEIEIFNMKEIYTYKPNTNSYELKEKKFFYMKESTPG